MTDPKFACRQLLKHPGFTVVTVRTRARHRGERERL
jgi:hypothetical protein